MWIIKKIFQLKNVALMLLVAIVCGAAAYGLPYFWDQNFIKVEDNLEEYQAVVVKNDVEFISSQLVKYVFQGRELAKSRIFREAIEGLSSKKRKTIEKAQENFVNFTRVSGFDAGYLFNLDGTLFASTEGRLVDKEFDYESPVKEVAAKHIPFFSPLHSVDGQLVSNLFLPLFPADAISSSVEPVKIVMLTVPMTEILRSFLSKEKGLEHESVVHLIQQTGDSSKEVVFSYGDNLKLQSIPVALKDVSMIQFGSRSDLYSKNNVYSTASFIPVINWWIMVETDVSVINAGILEFKGITLVIVLFGLAAFSFFILTLRFIFSTIKYHSKCEKLEAILAPLKKEHELMQTVLNTLSTPISLKDGDSGAFVFTNKAFTKFTNLKTTEVLGMTDNQVFDSVDAENLSHGDQMVTMSGNSYTHDISVVKRGKTLTLQVSVAPCSLVKENDAIMTTFRDVTAEKGQADNSIAMRQQIIDALVRAVESVPFLDGHTSLMRLLALETAETLLLSDADCATVEAAAILSQVGKTFIPKEIMEKEGKLTPEEILETQKYVEHTCGILEGIKFDLPITQTIWQMQENLDGSGYPHGLKGKEVSMLARILGVTNTFSAIVQKRSYRKAKTAQEAVTILQSMADTRFDGTVIDALDAVIHSKNGRDILDASNVDH